MNYRRKEQGVKAIQVVLGKTDVDEVVKVFGYNPLISEDGSNYILSPCILGPTSENHVPIKGIIPVNDGDYIVEENGVLSVMDEASFLRVFEQVAQSGQSSNERIYYICNQFNLSVDEVEKLTPEYLNVFLEAARQHIGRDA